MTEERKPFVLRLPVSVREQVVEWSKREGVSLNQFILTAVALQLGRLEGK